MIKLILPPISPIPQLTHTRTHILSTRSYEALTENGFHCCLSPVRPCCCSVAQSCLPLCDPTDCSLPTPLSMGFPRQEYWRGLPFPPPGDLPDPGIKAPSPASQADSLWLGGQGGPPSFLVFPPQPVCNRQAAGAPPSCPLDEPRPWAWPPRRAALTSPAEQPGGRA